MNYTTRNPKLGAAVTCHSGWLSNSQNAEMKALQGKHGVVVGYSKQFVIVHLENGTRVYIHRFLLKPRSKQS